TDEVRLVDGPAATKPVKIKPWLPYWAVFREDMRQTVRSWVYRTWVFVSVLTAIGYMHYRVAEFRGAGIVKHASDLLSDLLRWCVLGSVTLIIVLTAGCISAERGTLADSVLSRGISRYQYFLGKWHARLVIVLGTFLAMGLVVVVASVFLLHGDVQWIGSFFALLAVACILAIVISCGVSMSAVFSNSLLGIAVVWILVYGAGFVLWLLPLHYPPQFHVLSSLPYILRGEYHFAVLGRLVVWSATVSCVLAIFGLAYFSRRDV
ncbi:MAG TPA: ABC transporter permease, partial [Gemmataceae bacterium]|nr:ABC transporter permease [Gemmataceae bacterium]